MNSLRWKIFVSIEARFSPTSAIVQNLLYFLPSGRISFDQYLHVDPSHFSYPNTVAHVRRLETNSLATRQGEATKERGGKRKLYFTITAPGQHTLRQSLQAIHSLRHGLRW